MTTFPRLPEALRRSNAARASSSGNTESMAGRSVPPAASELGGTSRRGADHMCAAPSSQLRRHVTDAPGGTEDQDPLAFVQPFVDEEALPGGQAGQRKRSALDMAQPHRFRSEERGRDRRILGCNTVAIETRQGEDVVADCEVGDVLGDLLDHAGELIRHDRRHTAGGPVELVPSYGRRMHAHERLARARLRNLDLVDGQRIDTARWVQANRAHHRQEPIWRQNIDPSLTNRRYVTALAACSNSSRHRSDFSHTSKPWCSFIPTPSYNCVAPDGLAASTPSSTASPPRACTATKAVSNSARPMPLPRRGRRTPSTSTLAASGDLGVRSRQQIAPTISSSSSATNQSPGSKPDPSPSTKRWIH